MEKIKVNWDGVIMSNRTEKKLHMLFHYTFKTCIFRRTLAMTYTVVDNLSHLI